ncbi:MAG: hypothetical protein L0Y56_12655 [Nitrospira sp.]|nr:hypothetical protein [Nitrospira sp.]
MTMKVNPAEVIIAGENSFLRLSQDGGKTMAHRTSHWRVFWSPAGPGHALFIESELIDGIKIYSDNVALARYLQRQIEYLLHKPFGDTEIPVIDAAFYREGDPRSCAAERVESESDSIRLVWYDFIIAFNFSAEPGFNNRPIGVQTTFFPATSAEIYVNGKFATGKPWPEKRGEQQTSSACLAWCETWYRPRS